MATLATSGTNAFNQSAIKLIASALRLCQAIDEEEQPSNVQAQTSLDALNAMVSGWQANGLHVWCEEEAILFLQPGQPQYQLGAGSSDHACLYNGLNATTLAQTAAGGATSVQVASASGMASGDAFGVQLDAGTNYWTTLAAAPSGNTVTLAAALPSQATSGARAFDYTTPLVRPLRVPQGSGRRYNYASRIETPLISMARLDYDYLPNKYNAGAVNQIFYDPQTGNGSYSAPIGLMNVWMTPQNNADALRFVSQRPIQNFANLTNIPDFPSEWLAALKWNLAQEIAPEFGTDDTTYQRIVRMAETWFGRVQGWDKEPESFRFGVAFQPGYSR